MKTDKSKRKVIKGKVKADKQSIIRATIEIVEGMTGKKLSEEELARLREKVNSKFGE